MRKFFLQVGLLRARLSSGLTLLAVLGLMAALPGGSGATHIVINNGLAPPDRVLQ